MTRSRLYVSLSLLVLLPLAPPMQGQTRRRVFSHILNEQRVGDMAYIPECYLPQITNGPNYPAWSPDGKQVAFSMKGSIFRLTLGDRTAYELTSDKTYDSQPAWSPDGKWIVYTADLNEQIHLRLLDVGSGASAPLTSGNSLNVEPAWSPDGRKLAYVSTVPNGTFNIYVMPFQNGSPGRPRIMTSDFHLDPPTVYYGDMALHISPVWTADGRDLIFISNRDSKHGSGGFYRMRAEPGAPMRRFHYEETTWKARPSISPDGVKLVYSSYLGRQWQQLWAMPTAGGDAFPLTYGDFDRTCPRWSPDGSRIAFISNETGDTSLWIFHWFGGKLERVPIEHIVYKRPMQRLHVAVIDQQTGMPLPARVNLEAADGRAYAPEGSWFRADFFVEDHVEKEEYRYFYTRGSFDMMVPPGRTRLAFSHGLEYLPREVSLDVPAGSPASVRVALERLDNLPARGWWDGDNHFHMNYAGVYRNTPATLMQQAEAEDIHVLNNLICNKEQRIPDVGYFTGKPDPVSSSERILYHNQEYHPPFWGHSVFLNLKEHLIIPDYVGYQNTAVASLYPPNTTAFRAVHEEGGLAGYAHEAGANFPTDLALGTVDFLEANWPESMENLYHAWNCGYRIVASAGVDSFGNFYRGNVLGTNRVYVKSGPKLDYKTWIQAFRAGHSFVTDGPLIFPTIDGREPGDEIRFDAGGHEVKAVVEVESIRPIESIDLLWNGNLVATVKPDGGPLKARLEKAFPVEGSGWFAARTRGTPSRHPIRKPVPWGATMPVWVTVAGRPVRSRQDAQYLIDWLDRTLDRALAPPSQADRARVQWNNEHEKEQLRELYREARARLVARRDEAR